MTGVLVELVTGVLVELVTGVLVELVTTCVGLLVAMDVLVDTAVVKGLLVLTEAVVEGLTAELLLLLVESTALVVGGLSWAEPIMRVELTVKLAAALRRGLSDDGSLAVDSPHTLGPTRMSIKTTP